MRTTLTLDDDVARLIDETMRRERRTMKDVVNQALRLSLGQGQEIEPYTVRVHHTTLRPGIDPARMNQLADELEDETIMAKVRRDHP
ncbi:MAG TPA: ribbon-helix-helix protein, CopG family [Intrasporangiaceae bacterium]|nr:ribbon-helix-helix protein, CopG family [Intrasporangiaceae bacterium]